MNPMIKMTLLEKNLIEAILSSKVLNAEAVADIVGRLVVKERVFSEDALDSNKCCGFYLHFADNDTLSNLDPLPHHLGIQGSHKELSIGADFILFMKQDGIDFLEASFYGEALPTELLLSDQHGFTILEPQRP